jgi:hypothetical protein
MAKLLRGLRQGGRMTDPVFPTFWECPPPILLGLLPCIFPIPYANQAKDTELFIMWMKRGKKYTHFFQVMVLIKFIVHNLFQLA